MKVSTVISLALVVVVPTSIVVPTLSAVVPTSAVDTIQNRPNPYPHHRWSVSLFKGTVHIFKQRPNTAIGRGPSRPDMIDRIARKRM